MRTAVLLQKIADTESRRTRANNDRIKNLSHGVPPPSHVAWDASSNQAAMLVGPEVEAYHRRSDSEIARCELGPLQYFRAPRQTQSTVLTELVRTELRICPARRAQIWYLSHEGQQMCDFADMGDFCASLPTRQWLFGPERTFTDS